MSGIAKFKINLICFNFHKSTQKSGPLATSSLPIAFLPYSSVADDLAMKSLDKTLSNATFAESIDGKLQARYAEWFKSKSVASVEYVAFSLSYLYT